MNLSILVAIIYMCLFQASLSISSPLQLCNGSSLIKESRAEMKSEEVEVGIVSSWKWLIDSDYTNKHRISAEYDAIFSQRKLNEHSYSQEHSNTIILPVQLKLYTILQSSSKLYNGLSGQVALIIAILILVSIVKLFYYNIVGRSIVFLFVVIISIVPSGCQMWTQLGLDIDGEAASDQSGYSVSLNSNGDIVAIGAPGNDANTGHVRVYNFVGGNWTQLGLDIDGEASSTISGFSVSLNSNGNIVAIGAPANGGNSGNGAGHVRVYNFVDGNWTQLGLDIDGEAANDISGGSVSLNSNGDIVAIGATGNGNGAGHVRVYSFVGGNWIQLGLDIDGEAATDLSGISVSLNSNGTIVAIGANRNDGNGGDSGHVRVYSFVGGNWTQLGLDIDGEAAGDQSGWRVSLNSNGDIVAIGATGNDGKTGHVRVYELITNAPSVAPSISPTQPPSNAPSNSPTQPPSVAPSISPTQPPSNAPSIAPSNSPTQSPSNAPSNSPTRPSIAPSISPTQPPSVAPSNSPTQPPSKAPSNSPTRPSVAPSISPTQPPSNAPIKRGSDSDDTEFSEDDDSNQTSESNIASESSSESDDREDGNSDTTIESDTGAEFNTGSEFNTEDDSDGSNSDSNENVLKNDQKSLKNNILKNDNKSKYYALNIGGILICIEIMLLFCNLLCWKRKLRWNRQQKAHCTHEISPV